MVSITLIETIAFSIVVVLSIILIIIGIVSMVNDKISRGVTLLIIGSMVSALSAVWLRSGKTPMSKLYRKASLGAKGMSLLVGKPGLVDKPVVGEGEINENHDLWDEYKNQESNAQ